MSEALKPCPFCGGEAKFEVYGGTSCAVVCESCHCGTATVCLNDGMQAVKAWNRREERTCRRLSDGAVSACSACNTIVLSPPTWSYCPHCGARVVEP